MALYCVIIDCLGNNFCNNTLNKTTAKAPITFSHKKPKPITSYLSSKKQLITIISPKMAAIKTGFDATFLQ